jgi:hypothetical protein
MKTYNCTAFSDPSHGWLRVSKTLVLSLGIYENISSFSYENGRFVYLEEDRDYALFLDAMTKVGRPLNIREVFAKGPSKIRNYRRVNA